MHRTWVVTPAVVATVLAAQLGGQTPTDSQAAINLAVATALTQADAAIDWQCAMPHRDSSRRAARSMAAGAVLPFTEDSTADLNPGAGTGSTPGADTGSAPGSGPGQVATAEGTAKTIPGFGTGPGEKSATQVTGTLAGPDTADTWAIPLRAGDVFSATVRGAGGTLEVRDPNGVLVEGSSIDRSGIYPEASPLLGGGNATVDHVASVSGMHTLTIRRAKAGAGKGGSSTLPSASAPSASAPSGSAPSPSVPSGPSKSAPSPSGPSASTPGAAAPAGAKPGPKPAAALNPTATDPSDSGSGDPSTSTPATADATPADQAQVVQQVPYPAAPLAANSLTPTQQAIPAPANPAVPANVAAPANPVAPANPANPGPAKPAAPNTAAIPTDAGPSILPPAALTAPAPAAGAAASDPRDPASPADPAGPASAATTANAGNPAGPASSTHPGALAPDPEGGALAPDPSTGALPEATDATTPAGPALAPGTYQADLGIFRPPANVAPQKIVLEFGGATVEPKKFGMESATTPAQVKLSPLSSFMRGLGLTAADQPALMAKVADTFRKNMSDAGGGRIDVTISATPGTSTWGQPDVSRVVIGGTTKEAGISTVGISESVDPGNFVREETALVLLDRLAGPSNQAVSLTHYLPGTIDEAAKIEFVGRALGNIASHEAGHFLGSWHTDAASPRHDLMAPGDVVGAFGFGPDKIGGTPDDVATHFGQDTFAPQEGFTGTEDTKTRTAVGLRGAPNPS